MIRYSLQCADGHGFEEWFSNSADFDAQKAAGTLTCPECGGKNVDKGIMAPSVAKASASAPAPACPPQGCGGCAFAGGH